MKNLKTITLSLTIALIGAFANAKDNTVISVPIELELDQLFTAGTNTYLRMLAPEIQEQVYQGCGKDAILVDLDLSYKVKMEAIGSSVRIEGIAKCLVHKSSQTGEF